MGNQRAGTLFKVPTLVFQMQMSAQAGLLGVSPAPDKKSVVAPL